MRLTVHPDQDGHLRQPFREARLKPALNVGQIANTLESGATRKRLLEAGESGIALGLKKPPACRKVHGNSIYKFVEII